MRLTAKETRFLTALAREQNQAGARGPAHDLLRHYAYPQAPLTGPGSLAFSYEAVPLTSLLLRDCKDLQEIDDFLRRAEPIADPEWPWASMQGFRSRLEEARRCQANQETPTDSATNGIAFDEPSDRVERSV